MVWTLATSVAAAAATLHPASPPSTPLQADTPPTTTTPTTVPLLPTDTAPTAPDSFLGDAYPLIPAVRMHPAMMHWLDSIAGLEGPGLTGGATAAAHRNEYETLIGPLRGEAMNHLRNYRQTRLEFVRDHKDWLPDQLTRAFIDAEDYTLGRAAALRLLKGEDSKRFVRALAYFEPRYVKIWDDGKQARAFLDGSTPADRRRVGELLRRIASFFGADPAAEPISILYPVPVPDGYGRHAQTFHQHLIMEIRPGETLHDQISTVVHESAHFLFFRADRDAMNAAQAMLEEGGRELVVAWQALHEALPTAMAEGFADQQLKPSSWSVQSTWYERDLIDRYAKLLFPLVREALLDESRTIDAEFFREAFALYPEIRQKKGDEPFARPPASMHDSRD